MKKMIRIANAQGFWGDSVNAPVEMLKYGDIDYLTLDYLAEVTISIMQRQKLKNPNLGYAKDFVDLVVDNIDLIKHNNIKIITNAGGANPIACAKAIKSNIKDSESIKIAVIQGDDIYENLEKYVDDIDTFENIDTNESFHLISSKVTSANVYIDSFCVKDALSLGADIVLCGRVTDPGLTLGPMLHEFNWQKNDFNKLASGTLAGHIIECGAQCTGGNFSGWENVDNYDNIGYPIVNMHSSGDFFISKPENSGGLLNKYTVIEQILYEMGNPKMYLSPDVVVDFTSFSITEKDNFVHIKNVRGSKPTKTYKVSLSYENGYKASGQLTLTGPNVYDKAIKTSEIIWKRLENYGVFFENKKTEFLGYSSCHKDVIPTPKNTNEIVLRLSVKDNDIDKIKSFSKEIAPVITNGPSGITGFSGGRPKPQNIVAYWPALISKDKIQTSIIVI